MALDKLSKFLCYQLLVNFFLAHEVCTNHEHADCLRPEARARSHRCCPSTNIQNLRGGAQLFPRHTTCPRSHELLVSTQTNCLPSSLSTQSLLSSWAFWGLSPPTSVIKWKQGPGIQSWISKLFFLISRKYEMEAAWSNGSKGREFNLGFRNSVFWFPGNIKWKRLYNWNS